MRSKQLLFGAILFLGLLAMTSRSATDPDLWWHLRTGQWIVETGHVPHADPFSFTRGGSPWVSHEWLSDVLFYELWLHGGPGALIVFSSIVTSVGFLLLYSRCPGKPHWAAALAVLGALASAPSWGARPQMFTFALASLLLWLLERAENRPRLLLFIPPLFLLWLNLHAGFALGPALMFAYTVGLICESMAGRARQETRPIVTRSLLVTLVCLALVPLNPSGVALYRYPLNTLRSWGMRTFIVEWKSPNFHQLLYVPFMLVILLLFVAVAYSHSRLRGRILLPLFLTAAAALDAVRHIPIFTLLAIPVIAAALPIPRSLPALSPTPRAAYLTRHLRGQAFWYSAAMALLAVFAILRWIDLTREQPLHEAALFPEKAVAFLQAHQTSDRLFAYYDWGGYAIWKLDSQYRVFADGRADLYGDEILRQAIETVPEIHHEWAAILNRWKVRTILVPPNLALSQALLLDPNWTTAYRDRQAIVFERVSPD